MELLTREEFKKQVFARDGYECVFCDFPAADAHHILDRKLWTDGGYYLNNGASVCNTHHYACERTELSVSEVYEACGITQPALPPQLFYCLKYDKWGNEILPDGNMVEGELFKTPTVQTILRETNKLRLFYFHENR
jgi:hypothetical protein